MNDALKEQEKTINVKVVLAKKALFGIKKTSFDAVFEKCQIREHILEYLSPYQTDLLKKSVKENRLETEKFFADICKHTTAYSHHFNEKDVLGCCEVQFLENSKGSFFECLCEVLKIPNPKKPSVNFKDYDF